MYIIIFYRLYQLSWIKKENKLFPCYFRKSKRDLLYKKENNSFYKNSMHNCGFFMIFERNVSLFDIEIAFQKITFVNSVVFWKTFQWIFWQNKLKTWTLNMLLHHIFLMSWKEKKIMENSLRLITFNWELYIKSIHEYLINFFLFRISLYFPSKNMLQWCFIIKLTNIWWKISILILLFII